MMGRKVLLPIANVLVGAVLGLLALRMVAIYMGREAFGQAEAALSVVGLLYIFFELNMGDAHVKRVSEGVHAGDCFATYAVFRVVTGVLFAALAITAYLAYTGPMGRTLEDTTPLALIAAMVYYIVKALQQLSQSTFEARLESARSQVGSLVDTLVRIGLTLLVAAVYAALVHDSGPLAGRLDPGFFLWAFVRAQPAAALTATYVLGAFVAAAVTTFYLMRALERGRFRWAILRSYFVFALPLFAASAMVLLASYVDRAALTFFGTSVELADFQGPRRIVGVLDGIGAGVSLLLFPLISSMAAQGSREGVREATDHAVRYLSMLLLPTVAFLVVFPEPVINLILGKEWLGSAWVLSILAVYTMTMVLARTHVNLLVGTGHVKVAARLGIIASVVNVVLNLVLIPDDIQSLGIRLAGLKALGAALATLIAGLVHYALVIRATRRLHGYTPNALSLAKHVAAAAVMSAALLALDAYTPLRLEPWWSFAVYAALGFVVYALALVALREVHAKDLEYVRMTLHPGEMMRYLRDELGPRRR